MRNYNSFAEYVTLRFGDITIPHVKIEEPLRLECQHFLECIREHKQPLSDGGMVYGYLEFWTRRKNLFRTQWMPIK